MNNVKKALSIVLAIVMVACMMPMSVFAESGNVAKIDTTEYATLQAAVNAVTNGQTIVLTDNVTTPTIEKWNGTTFTIDLNGKTWTSLYYCVFVGMNNNLTIEDSSSGGIITNEGATALTSYEDPSSVTAVFDGSVNTTFNFNGGTIKNFSNLPLASGFFDQEFNFNGSNVELNGNGGLIGPSEFDTEPAPTTITAGKFTGVDTEEIEQYLGENIEIGKDIEVVEKAAAVCEIEGTPYSSLAAAIAVVPTDETETTIKMVADEVIPENVGIKIASGQNIILDLAGKKISGSDNTGKAFALITNNGTLTIVDETGEGKITYTPKTPSASNGYATDTIYNYNGTLTVKGGTIECNPVGGGTSYAIENSSNWGGKSVLNIEGGIIKANDNADSTIRVYMNGPATELAAINEVNITGGKIEGYFNVSTFGDCNGTDSDINISGGTLENVFLKQDSSPAPKADVDMTFSDKVEVTGKIMQSGAANIKEGFDVAVTGGTFGEGAFNSTIAPERIKVSGGNFADKSAEIYLAEGFELVAGESGFGVEEKEVCKINDKTYPSLEAAIADVPAGTETTIKLLEDITVDANIGVKVAKGQNIVLDLNGKTYTQNAPDASASYVIDNNGQLTITDTSKDKDGVIKLVPAQPDYSWSPAYASNVVNNRGSLTIEAGSLINDEEPRNDSGMPASGCYAVDCYAGSSLTVKGGTLKSGYIAVRTFNTSGGNTISVDVDGGTLEGMYCFYLQAASGTDTSTKAKVNITKGTFMSTDRDIFYSDAEKEGIVEVNVKDGTFEYQNERNCFQFWKPVVDAEVSGGTFSTEIPVAYCAKGFVPVEKDGKYGVEEGTLTDYYIDKNTCQSNYGKGGRMGRQQFESDSTKGRTIICLTTEQLNAIGEKVVIVGGDYGKETTFDIDCAYTYFYDGETKITAESQNCAAFIIIEEDGKGQDISGYGYYRIYNESAETENNFMFDTLYKNPTK